ncbi:MAG: MoxR family ATPase [Dehalococcoidia bacterium]|nr:MoxR family ATPase [Dehalococcoidia bacterium]
MTMTKSIADKIVANVEKVIIGKNDEVELALIALICRGHALIEDVPGVGKTMLAKSLARSLGCSFKRIQFTPDLLPTDITGVSVYNQKTGDFVFRPGPIIAQVVLADEINRATPKTQSALLEAMEERQITTDGVTHMLPEPFIVLATQNPIEYEGTFPLPEAQLDRFLLRISLGYPTHEQEVTIIEMQQRAHPVESLGQVVDVAEVLKLQEAVKDVYVDDLIKRYIVSISTATRSHEAVSLGASPRGSLGLFRATQARAMLKDRDYVTPDDVKALAAPVLSHRVIINPSSRMKDVTGVTIVEHVLNQAPVPGARPRDRTR